MVQRVGEQLGNYRLTRLLGAGGFAEVYLGEHVHLGTDAAIKVLHTRLEQEDAEAFRNEARTIARLKHPHIVRVLDFGIDNSTPFLVMDYASNSSLRGRYPRGTRLPLSTILSYVQQLADALQYAHDQKLIHRDLKPENILVDEHGELVLSDFGIATIAQSSRSQNTQDVVGTVAYMAPEQVQGRPRPASDQYSLGIVVYEWLTGTRPFQGTFVEIATQQVMTPPPPLRLKRPDLPLAVEQVVMTALHKDPHQRFGSVKAFAVAFEQACQPGQSPALTVQTVLAPPHPAPTPIPLAPPPPALPTNIATPPASQQESQVVTPAHQPSFVVTPRPSLTPSPVRLAPPPPLSSYQTSRQMPPPAKPQRRRTPLYVVLSALALLAIVFGVYFVSSLSTSTFHQEIKTGAIITSIQVGSGYTNGDKVDNASDTFHVGDTVFLVSNLGTVGGASLADTLSTNNAPVTTAGGIIDHTNSVYYDWVTVATTGVYTWIIDYTNANGVHEVDSITFQVV